MDIRGLRYFISAAECLNFTQAAKECFITQTAMSQHIANMEKELGFQLFRRNNRRVELTAAGNDFYRQMKDLVHSYDHAVQRSQNLSTGGEGRISLAIPSCIDGLAFLPRLRHFRDHYPQIKLTVSACPPYSMINNLKRGFYDAIVCWPHDLENSDEFVVQNLGSFKACVGCSELHPLAQHEMVTLEMLAEQHAVMIDLRGMPEAYRAMSRDWRKLGLTPPSDISFEPINSMEELLLYVSLNPAVTLLPEFVRSSAVRGLKYLDLDVKNPPMFLMGAGYLASNRNPALQSLIDVLRDSRIPLNY